MILVEVCRVVVQDEVGVSHEEIRVELERELGGVFVPIELAGRLCFLGSVARLAPSTVVERLRACP